MSLPPIQVTTPLATTLSAAAGSHAHLLDAMGALQRALALPGGDCGWRGRVDSCLRALQAAFADQARVAEGADGGYAELLAHAPRLAHRVATLADEHAALAQTIR